MTDAILFQHLLMAGGAGIGYRATLGIPLGAESFGLELGKVVATTAARCVFGGQPARCLPAT